MKVAEEHPSPAERVSGPAHRRRGRRWILGATLRLGLAARRFRTVPDTFPQRIGKYDITDLLGQGAMGVVYRGLDPHLGRYVAIKVMSQGIATDQELRDRFLREARAAGSLQHPNIITIFDFGEAEGSLYLSLIHI